MTEQNELYITGNDKHYEQGKQLIRNVHSTYNAEHDVVPGQPRVLWADETLALALGHVLEAVEAVDSELADVRKKEAKLRAQAKQAEHVEKVFNLEYIKQQGEINQLKAQLAELQDRVQWVDDVMHLAPDEVGTRTKAQAAFEEKHHQLDEEEVQEAVWMRGVISDEAAQAGRDAYMQGVSQAIQQIHEQETSVQEWDMLVQAMNTLAASDDQYDAQRSALGDRKLAQAGVLAQMAIAQELRELRKYMERKGISVEIVNSLTYTS